MTWFVFFFFEQQLDLTLGIKIGTDLSEQNKQTEKKKKKRNWGNQMTANENGLLEQLPRADATRRPLSLPPLSFLRVRLPPAEMWTGGDPSGDSLVFEPPPVTRLRKLKEWGGGLGKKQKHRVRRILGVQGPLVWR